MFNRCTKGARRAGKSLFLSEVWISLVELPHLSDGPPTEITVAGIPQIQVRDLLEPTRRVKARGQFVSDRLIVIKAICTGRADRLLVQAHRLGFAAFDPGDLCADQGGSVLKISATIPFPSPELGVMSMNYV